MNLLNLTVYISLIVQVITGIILGSGIFFNIPKEHYMLKDINMLEFIVQTIEFIFYIYISIAVIKLNSITPRRYFDWNITTPTMLISTILFFRYQQKIESGEDTTNIRLKTVIYENKTDIIKIIMYNAGMLLFGLLGELGLINIYLSNILGFICFIAVFNIIYKYAKNSKEGLYIYYFFLIVWGLYGVAQLFPVIEKNITYNLLDIVAKNFYGIFIFYKIYKNRI